MRLRRMLINQSAFSFRNSPFVCNFACRLISSLVVGFLIGDFASLHLLKNASSLAIFCTRSLEEPVQSEVLKKENHGSFKQELIYIGMMSMENKMYTRVRAALNTWAKQKNVKVEIFANNNGTFNKKQRFYESYLEKDIRVIQPAGVTDYTYPPQKKSFSMVKFMHDMYLDKFDWFIRLDDDAYVDFEKLQVFLSRLNSSKPFYLGAAATGKNKEDRVPQGQNYCLGGPGMIFSKELLRQLGPKLKHCLTNLWTEHEDIELGRCVTYSSGKQCIWSWEMAKLFRQVHLKEGGIVKNIDKIKELWIDEGITFHANKDMKYQHNFHVKMLRSKIAKLIEKVEQHEKGIDKDFDLAKDIHYKVSNVYPNSFWYGIMDNKTFQSSNGIYTYSKDNLLKRMNKGTDLYLQQVEDESFGGQKILQYAHKNIFYTLNFPLSFDFTSDIVIRYINRKRQEGKKTKRLRVKNFFSKKFHFMQEQCGINTKAVIMLKGKKRLLKKNYSFCQNEEVPVNFVVTLNSGNKNFRRFLQNFESAFLKRKEAVNLFFLPFAQNPIFIESNESLFKPIIPEKHLASIKTQINRLRDKYASLNVHLDIAMSKDDFFSKMDLNVKNKEKNKIIYFCDIDFTFDPATLVSIRRNTIKGKRIYSSAYFCENNCEIESSNSIKLSKSFNFEKFNGRWEYFNNRSLSIYSSDYASFMKAPRNHWNKLQTKHLLETNLEIFHSPEPAAVRNCCKRV